MRKIKTRNNMNKRQTRKTMKRRRMRKTRKMREMRERRKRHNMCKAGHVLQATYLTKVDYEENFAAQ
jgi:hypothetical protein